MSTRHRLPRYYGWTIVATGVLCAALSAPGQSFVLALYIDPLIRELGISRVAIASLYGMCTLTAAACLPFVGRRADRTTARRYFGGVLALLALAIALLASVRSVAMLAVAFFALRLLGQGAIGIGTLTTTVRWFRRHRARALSIVGLGYALGEMTFPGLVYALTEWRGWRGSLVVLAVVYLVVAAPIVSRLMRERDETREPWDGRPLPSEDGPSAEPDAGATDRDARPDASFTLGQAMRTRVFWGALLCVAVTPMVLTGLIFHQVALFDSIGWGGALVPSAFLAWAIGAVCASLGTGLALDHVPARWGITGAAGVAIMGLVAARSGLPPQAGAVLYGALLGMANGIANTTNAVLWPNYFGVESVGAIKGMVSGVRNGASAIGAPLVAALFARTDSVGPVTLGVGVLFLAAGIGALLLRPPQRGSATVGATHPLDEQAA